MKPSLLLALAFGLSAATIAPRARADVPPSCAALDVMTTCASTSVNQPCPSGGTCTSLECENTGSGGMTGLTTTTVCLVCPTLIPDPSGVCIGAAAVGKNCGASGVCAYPGLGCGGAESPLACYTNIPVQTTGAGGSSAAGAAGAAGSAGAATGGAAGASGATAAGGTGGTGQAGTSSAHGGSIVIAQGGTTAAAGTGSVTPVVASTPPLPELNDVAIGSGCAITPVRKRGAFAAMLALVGLAALFATRRRAG